MKQKNKHLDL